MRRALLLTLVFGLAVWIGRSVAQRGETTSLKPIASTPTPGAQQPQPSPTVAPEPANQPAIATTRPPVAAPPITVAPTGVQPAATWPAPSPAGQTTPAPMPALSPTPGTQAAGLFLEKTGPASVAQGQSVSYEIIVRNSFPVPAHQVRVEDQLPAGARYLGGEPKPDVQNDRLVWDVGTLEPGAERRFKVELQSGGEGDLSFAATATFSTRNSPRVLRPKLELTVAAPESAPIGGPVALQMKIINTGTGPAANVVVHDTLPASLKHPEGTEVEADLGTLAPGEAKTLTLEVVAQQPGKAANQASVRADGLTPVVVETAVLVTGPALGVWMSGPTDTTAGREVEYAAEAANTGTGPAGEARLSVTLPDGVEFVSAGEGGTYQPSDRTVEWTLGMLAAGQSRRVAIKVRLKEPGERTLQARFRAERGQEAKVEVPVRIAAKPALLLEVAGHSEPVKVGAEVIYEVRVLNQGSQPATGVQILVTVPEGLPVVDADGALPYWREGQKVHFGPVPQLAVGADLLYRVRVKAARPGDWRLRAELTSEQMPQALSEEANTRVLKPDEPRLVPELDDVKK